MSNRIIAFIVLLLILGVPIGLYWYFITSAKSTISVNLGGKSIPFTLSLEGTFHMSYLPLVDTLLKIEKSCESSCDITDIMPTEYRFTATATGYESTGGKISIARGEQKSLTLAFKALPRILPFEMPRSNAMDRFEILQENDENYRNVTLLGASGSILFLKEKKGRNIEISTFDADEKREILFSIPGMTEGGYLDGGMRFIIFTRGNTTEIYRLSNGERYILPGVEKIRTIQERNIFAVTTDSGLLEHNNDTWEENPLFDDMIDRGDISIGLVRNREKLSILGLPEGTKDVIYRIEKSTGIRKKILENTEAYTLWQTEKSFGYTLTNGERMEVIEGAGI